MEYVRVELPNQDISTKSFLRERRVNQWHRAFRALLKAINDDERGGRK